MATRMPLQGLRWTMAAERRRDVRRWRMSAFVGVAALCLTVLSGSVGAAGSAGVGPVFVSGIGIQTKPPAWPTWSPAEGKVWEGSTLSAVPGTWTGSGTISFGYEWVSRRRCGSAGARGCRLDVHGLGLRRRLVPLVAGDRDGYGREQLALFVAGRSGGLPASAPGACATDRRRSDRRQHPGRRPRRLGPRRRGSRATDHLRLLVVGLLRMGLAGPGVGANGRLQYPRPGPGLFPPGDGATIPDWMYDPYLLQVALGVRVCPCLDPGRCRRDRAGQRAGLFRRG